MTSKILWTSRESFMDTGIKQISEVDVLLDIGCGIRPHDYITPQVYICCEPYEEYVDVLKKKTSSATETLYIILNYGWEEVVSKFAEKSVDTIFILDVIEHLEKEEGKRLLKETEKIAKKQIVIFTPLGFVENKTADNGKDAWGLNGAEWQMHRSGWLPEDFDDTWNIIACEDLYKYNNIGEELDSPFGAFWAIKTIENLVDSKSSLLKNQQDVILPMLIGEGKRVMGRLRRDLENSNRLNGEMVQEKSKLNSIIMDLQDEVQSFLTTNEALKKANRRKEEDISKLQSEIVTLQETVMELQTEMNDLIETKKYLETNNAKLRDQNESFKLDTLSLKKSISVLQSEINHVREELSAVKNRYKFFEWFLMKNKR